MPETIAVETETETKPTVTDASLVEGRRRSRVVLSVEEAQGIADILANLLPPTEELKRAWHEYQKFADENPGAGW